MPRQTIWWDTETNQIIRVARCQLDLNGKWTFYRTSNLNKQGTRVRCRPSRWYDDEQEAKVRLLNYCWARKPRYEAIELEEALRRLEAAKPAQFNPIFGKRI